jgi:hypothetical protein
VPKSKDDKHEAVYVHPMFKMNQPQLRRHIHKLDAEENQVN